FQSNSFPKLTKNLRRSTNILSLQPIRNNDLLHHNRKEDDLHLITTPQDLHFETCCHEGSHTSIQESSEQIMTMI
ncbi:hypothetical protein TVAG_554240, partial [Trichomonas vaginalis G3]